ncbi:MAG: hypothetical protein WBX25_31330 [Rhodomicrobium sp.]
MSTHGSKEFKAARTVDATGEEIADFIGSMLNELTIMASSASLAPEHRDKLKRSTAFLIAYLDNYPAARPPLGDATDLH